MGLGAPGGAQLLEARAEAAATVAAEPDIDREMSTLYNSPLNPSHLGIVRAMQGGL